MRAAGGQARAAGGRAEAGVPADRQLAAGGRRAGACGGRAAGVKKSFKKVRADTEDLYATTTPLQVEVANRFRSVEAVKKKVKMRLGSTASALTFLFDFFLNSAGY